MAQTTDIKEDQPAQSVPNGDAAKGAEKAPEKTDAQKVAAQLDANVALVEKSVKAKETRMGSGRLLRTTAGIRKRLTRAILQQFIARHLPEDAPLRPILLAILEQVQTGTSLLR